MIFYPELIRLIDTLQMTQNPGIALKNGVKAVIITRPYNDFNDR